jgi:hypothetical protein
VDALGNYVASIVAAGAEATGTALGPPVVVEDLTMDFEGQSFSQKGTYMESLNNPTIVRGDPKLNMTVLMSGAGMPTLMPGDYIGVNVGMTAASTNAVPASIPMSRWVVNANSVMTAGVNKMGLKLELDRPNSAVTLKEF